MFHILFLGFLFGKARGVAIAVIEDRGALHFIHNVEYFTHLVPHVGVVEGDCSLCLNLLVDSVDVNDVA